MRRPACPGAHAGRAKRWGHLPLARGHLLLAGKQDQGYLQCLAGTAFRRGIPQSGKACPEGACGVSFLIGSCGS